MAEKKSYWNQIHLKYLDGLEIIQVLDAPTIRRLENGDEELLQQIRKNVEESGVAEAAQQPACIEEKTLACTSVDNLEFEDEASNSDLEENTVDSQPVSWTRDATELLISLYEEHEEELENPRNKKKDIWKKITAELNEAGYKYVQSKVEGKWKSLLASHKDLSLNKKRTGQKRKTFQYFEKIDNIIAKRHDINPPFTSESSKQKETKFNTKVDKIISCTSSQTDEESSTVSNDISSFSPSSTDTADINSDSGKNVNAENSETPLSKSTTAKRRRENRKINSESNSGIRLLEYLKEMEKQRKEEYKEREKKRDQRAQEKNNLFREFLDIMKNKNN